MSSFELGSPVRNTANPSQIGMVVDADGEQREGYVYVMWEGQDEFSWHPVTQCMSPDAVPQSTHSSDGLPRGVRYSIPRLVELAELINAISPQQPGFVDAVRRIPPVEAATINELGDDLSAALGMGVDGDDAQQHPPRPPPTQSSVPFASVRAQATAHSPPGSGGSSQVGPVSGAGGGDSSARAVPKISTDYPEHSVLKFYGKREPVAFSRGDIVERSDNWSRKDEDGGPGSRGLVESVNDSGDKIWVKWKSSDRQSYFPSDLKVVDRVQQINVGDFVERGPDWHFSLKDQDGGQGNIGTVSKFGEYDEICVVWENNRQANYRWGFAYDLKVVYSEYPREESGFGSNWAYIEPSIPKSPSQVQPQLQSQPVTEESIRACPMLAECNNPSRILLQGDFVVRGSTWQHGDEDGGDGRVGVVQGIPADGYVTVKWNITGVEKKYSYGCDDVFEVSLVLFACLGRQEIKFKHWTARASSLPGSLKSSPPCKYCTRIESTEELSRSLPFLCEHCSFFVCGDCYRRRPPPPTANLKSRFSLTRSREIFKSTFPVVSDEKMNEFFATADGDLVDAMVKYHRELPPLEVEVCVDAGGKPECPFSTKKVTEMKSLLLHGAAIDGNLNLVKKIISGGLDVNMPHGGGRTILHTAALNGRFDIVQYLIIEAGADPYAQDDHLEEPLAYCAQNGYVDIANFLMEQGAHVNNASKNSHTPLMRAVSNGKQDMVELLLEKNADPDWQDADDNTACHIAACKKYVSCLEQLIKRRANINVPNSELSTPMHECGKFSSDACADVLIKNGAILNTFDKEGRLPIHTAALHDSVKVLDLILAKDPTSIDAVDKDGNTVLYEAFRKLDDAPTRTSGRAAESLILKGARLCGDMLHLAADNGMLKVCQLLVQKGLNTNSKDANGRTLLQIAIEKGNLEIIKFLAMDANADINISDPDDNDAILSLLDADMERADILEILLGSTVANPFKTNKRGRTALHQSSSKGFLRSVQLILNHPACTEENLNLADSNGSTALHEAVAKNHPEIVKCLIEEGANPAKENHNGQTANDFALSKKLPNIKELLDRAPEILKLRLEARKAEEAEEAEKQSLRSPQAAAPALAPAQKAETQKIVSPTCPPEYPRDIAKLSWNDIEFSEVDPIIGEGSFGIVYRGKYYPESRRDSDGIDVAIKVMSSIMVPTQKDYELIRSKTLQEATTVKHIADKVHPDSIVNLIGVVEGAVPTVISKLRDFELKKGDETVLGIVMKYEGGGSLENLLYKSGRKLTLEEKLRILVGLAFSVAELHGARPDYFIHGDIKPDNILLSSTWPPVVKLTDFGLTDTRRAVIDSMGAVQASVLRTTLVKQGNTPIYSAPEILPSFETGEPTHSHSRTSDMYAFGLVAWEILSGEKPFGDASNFIQFVYKVQSGQRPDMAKLPIDLPLAVKDMIQSLLNPERLRRMTASACFSVLNHTYSKLCSDQFDIVFSHPWVNKGILRHVYRLLTDQGYRIWFDEFDHGYDLKEVLDRGVRKSAVILACVNESYQKSADCMQELKAVADEHGKPVITLLTQSNDSIWASTELRRLCSFPEKKSVDISAAAEMLDKDGNPVDWENPDDKMMSKLEDELHPLYRILRYMQIPRSLLAHDGAPDEGLLRRTSSDEEFSHIDSNSSDLSHLKVDSPGGEVSTVEEEIWKIIHDDRLLLNPAGMKAFLEDKGLVEIEFLSLCDETTFNDMKPFIKQIPRKKLEKLIGEMTATSTKN